jgi:hypothetical protein
MVISDQAIQEKQQQHRSRLRFRARGAMTQAMFERDVRQGCL